MQDKEKLNYKLMFLVLNLASINNITEATRTIICKLQSNYICNSLICNYQYQ